MPDVKELLARQRPSPAAASLASLLAILSALINDLDEWADAYDHRNAKEIRSVQIRFAEHNAGRAPSPAATASSSAVRS